MLEVEGVVSSDPIADFLEFCALCSNQKEQEEAEGGVSDFFYKRMLYSILQ